MPSAYAISEQEQNTQPPRKVWTRQDCDDLLAAGLFTGQRYELIEGDLIQKMGKRRPHVIALTALAPILYRLFGSECVQTESPIDVSAADNPTSEPEPDAAVLRKPVREFRAANPSPADVLLAIEIADTTAGFDLGVKARLYARAAIADYWVIDLNKRRVVVHRDPAEGRYRSIAAYGETESVSPLAMDSAKIPVIDLVA